MNVICGIVGLNVGAIGPCVGPGLEGIGINGGCDWGPWGDMSMSSDVESSI